MQVILLERIRNLGNIGDHVRVKGGYARNYLLPQNKALRANDSNRLHFESKRHEIEQRNFELLGVAEQTHGLINAKQFIIIRQAGENGHLYGSASPRDIAIAIGEQGFSVERQQVVLSRPIKAIGVYRVVVKLHPDLDTTVFINVARSEEEANQHIADTQKQDVQAKQGEEIAQEEVKSQEPVTTQTPS